MKRILMASVVVLASAGVSQAGERKPLFPRLHNAAHRLFGQPSGPMFLPVPAVIPQQMPAIVPATFNRVSDAVRGLTLLPGSFGGCGPNGCPR